VNNLILRTVFLGSRVQLCLAQNLSESYAPVTVKCPEDITWIRPAIGLSLAEEDWVYGRKQVVLDALGDYLRRLCMQGFSLTDYLNRLRGTNYTAVPTIGLAISGGGYASAFT